MMENSTRPASRLFLDLDLSATTISIPAKGAHYLSHVLRLRPGDPVVVFNGRGDERRAIVTSLARHRPELELRERLVPLQEPGFRLTLIQALVKSDAMDLIVQKAVELGVCRLIAVKTQYSVIKLDAERAARRVAHWSKIAQSACEQSGRHKPPQIQVADSLSECFSGLSPTLRIALLPDARETFHDVGKPSDAACILVGPEGGFSASDLSAIEQAEFQKIWLSPRVLRADTAAIAACSMAQLLWGDSPATCESGRVG